jgi:hypothetical protein
MQCNAMQYNAMQYNAMLSRFELLNHVTANIASYSKISSAYQW